MKILLTEWYREWRRERPQALEPAVLSLENEKILFALLVSVGNGDYDEACIESDSPEAREFIKGLLCGTGNAKQVGRSLAVEQCRLYREGYETYLQGTDSYFFVNPMSRPELFQGGDLEEYVTEFKEV